MDMITRDHSIKIIWIQLEKIIFQDPNLSSLFNQELNTQYSQIEFQSMS